MVREGLNEWTVSINNFQNVDLDTCSPRSCFLCRVFPGFLYPRIFTCDSNLFCGACMRGIDAAVAEDEWVEELVKP
jgi:hypothetical protein